MATKTVTVCDNCEAETALLYDLAATVNYGADSTGTRKSELCDIDCVKQCIKNLVREVPMQSLSITIKARGKT